MSHITHEEKAEIMREEASMEEEMKWADQERWESAARKIMEKHAAIRRMKMEGYD